MLWGTLLSEKRGECTSMTLGPWGRVVHGAQLRKRAFQFERYVGLDLRLYPGLGEW